MKNKAIYLLVFIILLTSCNQKQLPAQTEPPITSSTLTNTPIPIISIVTSTDTPVPTDLPTHETNSLIIYSHDFSFDDKNWTIGELDNEFIKINTSLQNDKFHMTLEALRDNVYGRYCLKNHTFENFILSVEASLVDGPALSSYGLLFRRSNSDSDILGNYYELRLNNNGEYRINLRSGGTTTALLDWTKSEAIINEGTNLVVINASGPLIRIFINDNEIATISSETLKQGQICFYVSLTNNGDSKTVEYDNISISSNTP